MSNKKDRSHAVVPKYLGGQLVEDNKAELTLPLHAFHHLLIQENTKGNDKEANRWAVGAVVRRMDKEDLDEFNRLVDLHERDRRKWYN